MKKGLTEVQVSGATELEEGGSWQKWREYFFHSTQKWTWIRQRPVIQAHVESYCEHCCSLLEEQLVAPAAVHNDEGWMAENCPCTD